MFLDVILLVLIAYLNAGLAKRKGKSPWLWGLLTIVAFFIFAVIGEVFVLSMFYKGPMTQSGLQQFFLNNYLSLVFCLVCGFGGYLLIRFILDRAPDIADDSNS